MASWSRARLGYLKCYAFVVKISNGIPQIWVFVVKIPVGRPQVLCLGYFDFASFVFSWSRSRLGCLKFCGVVVKTSVRIRKVLWLRGQDIGWDTLRFVASWSRSRLGYLTFGGFMVNILFEIPPERSLLGCLKFCGCVVKTAIRDFSSFATS